MERDSDRRLRLLRFDNPAMTMTSESDFDTVLSVTARRARLDKAIAQLAADSEFTRWVPGQSGVDFRPAGFDARPGAFGGAPRRGHRR